MQKRSFNPGDKVRLNTNVDFCTLVYGHVYEVEFCEDNDYYVVLKGIHGRFNPSFLEIAPSSTRGPRHPSVQELLDKQADNDLRNKIAIWKTNTLKSGSLEIENMTFQGFTFASIVERLAEDCFESLRDEFRQKRTDEFINLHFDAQALS